MDVYKSLNISIGTVMKNPEMLKFIPNHLKTKKCVRMQLQNYLIYKVTLKLPYLYVPDQYKSEQMCDKAILESGRTLKSVPDYCKNQDMCNKALDNYPRALEFVPECYKGQKMCDKVVNTHSSTIQFVPKC